MHVANTIADQCIDNKIPRKGASLPDQDAGISSDPSAHDSQLEDGLSGGSSYGHPATRTYHNPDSPITVLIIGPSQNGKTTFINRLISIAANKVEMGKEGDKTGSCTLRATEYDVEVPTSDYTLVDRDTHLDFEVPDMAADEEKILRGNKWKRITSDKYAIRLRDPHAPYLKLHLIDTPGLDDSKGRDLENMEEVLATLNRLSQAKDSEAWKRQLNAIVLVYNANNAFTNSFQDMIKHYYECMPNLFGTMAVVNTHFDLINLNQKRQHLIRDKLLKTTDNARRHIIKTRAEDFKKLHGGGLSPTHFFIDNRPPDAWAYAELLSRNTISDIIMYLRSSMDSPMPIAQMRVIKSRDMQTIDAKLRRGLEEAVNRWSKTRAELEETASDRELLRSEMQQNRENLGNAIERCEADLSRWDNETKWDINPYMTTDSPSSARLFFRGTLLGEKIQGTLSITEDEFDEFWVKTQDGPSGRWLNYRWEASPRTWVGSYEGEPGKSPNLLAKSWTTNRVKHKDEIVRTRRELRGLQGTLAEKEETWEGKFSNHAPVPETDTDRKLEELVSWIETCKHLMQVLKQKSPPLDTGFNLAARERYRKLPSRISANDLYDFVRAESLDIELVEPLRRVGLEDSIFV